MNLENITSYLSGLGVEVESWRKPGLYGILVPGPGGRIAVVRHMNLRARLDVSTGGHLDIHPMGVTRPDFVVQKSFWQSLLSGLPTVIRQSFQQ